MNKKGRIMRIACNLIKARPCAPSVIRKERYLVISNPVSMFKRMEEKEIFIRGKTNVNYNLNYLLMIPDNYRDNQHRSLKPLETLTTDQPAKDQLRL